MNARSCVACGTLFGTINRLRTCSFDWQAHAPQIPTCQDFKPRWSPPAGFSFEVLPLRTQAPPDGLVRCRRLVTRWHFGPASKYGPRFDHSHWIERVLIAWHWIEWNRSIPTEIRRSSAPTGLADPQRVLIAWIECNSINSDGALLCGSLDRNRSINFEGAE